MGSQRSWASAVGLSLIVGALAFADRAPNTRDVLGEVGDGSIWFDDLRVGKTYTIDTTNDPRRSMPLMPFNDPRQASLAQITQTLADAVDSKLPILPPKSRVTVLEVVYREEPSARPWYRVKGFTDDGKPLGEGWLNSSALMGQRLNGDGSLVVIREVGKSRPSMERQRHPEAESPYEGGVKFYVHKTKQPGTVKFYRLLLADGTHCYTVSTSEVRSLTKSRSYRAKVEPMEAYVYTRQQPETTRLYRFSQIINGTWRAFYTAFGPEKQDVAKQRNSKLHRMKAYVFPSTYQPAEQSDIIPMYCCLSPVSGEHFYTTSEEERDDFIRVLEERR